MPELIMILFLQVGPSPWKSSATPFYGTLEDCQAAAIEINDTSPTHWAVCANLRGMQGEDA